MVTDELAWSVQLQEWIPDLLRMEVPLLGICYGHQLIARAMGGRVDYHPRGREIGTVAVNLRAARDRDPLFNDLPATIDAHVVHAQTVVELPPDAICLAHNDFEPHHAFRLGAAAWGVQFHPEYDSHIMRSYVEQLSDELEASGTDTSQLIRDVHETPQARELLARFAKLSGSRG
jgi:GMP synthase (glutamine-hydrolysing)